MPILLPMAKSARKAKVAKSTGTKKRHWSSVVDVYEEDSVVVDVVIVCDK